MLIHLSRYVPISTLVGISSFISARRGLDPSGLATLFSSANFLPALSSDWIQMEYLAVLIYAKLIMAQEIHAEQAIDFAGHAQIHRCNR